MNYSNADKELLINNQAVVYSKILLYDEEGNLLHTFTEDDFLVDWDYEDFRYVPNKGFIGEFVERLLDGNLKNIPDNISLENKEIELQVGIKGKDSEDINYYSYGRFIITSISESDTTGKYKFESCDYTKKFNTLFDANSIAYPCTAMQLLNAACNQTNVFVKDDDVECCIYITPEDGLEEGNYCIKYKDDYYEFYMYELFKNNILILKPGESIVTLVYVDGNETFTEDYDCEISSSSEYTELESVVTPYYDFANNYFLVENNQFEENSTCRDVVCAIAKLAYTWARINENNELVLDFVQKSTIEVDTYDNITTDEYYEAKIIGEQIEPINKISIGMSQVEGENVTVGDTDTKFDVGEIHGKCEQASSPSPTNPQEIKCVRGSNQIVFSGKNKLNLSFNDKSAIGVDAEYNNDYMTLNGTATSSANYNLVSGINDKLKAGTYTLILKYISGTQTNGAIRISVGDSSMQPAENDEHRYFSFVSPAGNTSNIVVTQTLNEDVILDKISLYINSGVIFDDYSFELYLVEGTYTVDEIPDYEAYNVIKYNIDLPVANLFDKDTMVLNAYISYSNGDLADSDIFRTVYLKCKPSTTYTFSQSVSSNRHILGFTSDDNISTPKTLTNLVDMNNTFDKKYTFTTNANTKYVFIMVSKTDVETSDINDILNSIQIEEGNVANAYTPYGVTPIELNAIGTYKDYIYENNGKFYLHKEIGTYIFDGEETMNLQNGNKRVYIPYRSNNYPEPLHTTSISQLFGLFSDKLSEKTAGQTWGGVQGISYDYSSSNNVCNFDISINGITTLEGYRAAIKDIMVKYILQTPTGNEITEEEYPTLIDQLNKLKDITFPYETLYIDSYGDNDINSDLLIKMITPNEGGWYEENGEHIEIDDNIHLKESIMRIDDNPLTYTEQLRRIAINNGVEYGAINNLLGLTYTPMTIKTIGHPWLLGDELMKVKNLSNNDLYFYPFDRKISYKGYLTTELSANYQNNVSQKYQNNNNIVDRMSHTEIVVDKANKKIESIAQEVTETTDKMSKVTQDINGVSTQIENINKTVDDNTKEIAAIQETIDGLSVEKSVTGGNNLIKNSVGYFGNDFWMIDDSNEGNVKTLNNIDVKNNSISACALLLQNETVYQKITEIKNGSYYISFRYKKLLNLATCKLVINGEEFELTSDSWQDEGKELAVTSNNIQISLISNMDDSCLITDLIVSNGTKKVSWTQNANETYTDGVKIGKGITITATGSDTELSATASSIDIINTRNRESTSTFDKYGIKTNSLESKGTVRIADKLIISKVGDQMWISTL